MIVKLFNKLSNLPLRYTDLFYAFFMAKTPSKKSAHIVEGTMIICQGGGFVAYYDHRSDIIANGETEKECLKVLRYMYKISLEAEEAGEIEKPIDNSNPPLPESFRFKKFTDRVSHL